MNRSFYDGSTRSMIRNWNLEVDVCWGRKTWKNCEYSIPLRLGFRANFYFFNRSDAVNYSYTQSSQMVSTMLIAFGRKEKRGWGTYLSHGDLAMGCSINRWQPQYPCICIIMSCVASVFVASLGDVGKRWREMVMKGREIVDAFLELAC